MSDLSPIHDIDPWNLTRRRKPRESIWKHLWPTHRQATILADRSIPKPRTRGEASELIETIAKAEGWG